MQARIKVVPYQLSGTYVVIILVPVVCLNVIPACISFDLCTLMLRDFVVVVVVVVFVVVVVLLLLFCFRYFFFLVLFCDRSLMAWVGDESVLPVVSYCLAHPFRGWGIPVVDETRTKTADE